MKKINLLLFIVLTVISCQGKADYSAVIEHCSDYYNPFAWNLMWHFKYPEILEKDQRIKINFLRKDSTDKTVTAFGEHILGQGQTEVNLYWFMQNKSDTECTFKIDVIPCERRSNSWTFYHRPHAPYELISATYKHLVIPISKEVLLAKIYELPLNVKSQSFDDMVTNRTTIFSFNLPPEKSSNYLSLEILIKVSLIEYLQTPKTLSKSLPDLPEKDLLELKEKVEKDFQQGQGSLPDLKAIQQELNDRRKRNADNVQK